LKLPITGWCPPEMWTLVYKPHELVRYTYLINHRIQPQPYLNWRLSWGPILSGV
jgi:hypothetical protein